MRHASALVAAILAGCSYDWQIAPLGSGGSGGAGSGGSGSGGERPSDAGPHDAAADVEHDAPADTDAAIDAGPDCAALLTKLDAARTTAKSCTLGGSGECVTSITDECGCASYVTQGGSQAANAFASAVSAFTSAACAPSCSTCLVSSGACLLNGGSAARCVP